MPMSFACCISLPPATISSVPIYDFAKANEEQVNVATDGYYPCCGKSICKGCIQSFAQSGNDDKCPFCNSDRADKTDEDGVEEIMKRAEANDAASICLLADCYYKGLNGVQQDHAKAMELFTKSAELGSSRAHSHLGKLYHDGGYLKKARFHFKAGAMVGHEVARFYLGCMEAESRNIEQAVKHWTIAASAGECYAMHNLLIALKKRDVSRESIDEILKAYNSSCVEMRSEARDAFIHKRIQ
jgi:hypothetical protein